MKTEELANRVMADVHESESIAFREYRKTALTDAKLQGRSRWVAVEPYAEVSFKGGFMAGAAAMLRVAAQHGLIIDPSNLFS